MCLITMLFLKISLDLICQNYKVCRSNFKFVKSDCAIYKEIKIDFLKIPHYSIQHKKNVSIFKDCSLRQM